MLIRWDQDGTGVGLGVLVGAAVGVGRGVEGGSAVVVGVAVGAIHAKVIAANATKMRTVSCIPRNIPTKPLMAMSSRRIWA